MHLRLVTVILMFYVLRLCVFLLAGYLRSVIEILWVRQQTDSSFRRSKNQLVT